MEKFPDLPKFWNIDIFEVKKRLDSSDDGLTDDEAKRRLSKYGDNVLATTKPLNALNILIGQFKNWLIIILIIASFISLFLGDSFEAVVILTLVVLSVFFGFFQEYKAEKTLSQLKKFINQRSRVRRGGVWKFIDTKNIVPGDVAEVRIGDKIPADLRLIKTDNFQIDESSLTGESMPAPKQYGVLNESSDNPTKLTNIAFMGTVVTEGKAMGIVIATGRNTFFGNTSKLLENIESETDFQVQIKNFSLFLFRVILVMTVLIFVINSFMKKDIMESFLFALALAIGITPEMLPAIITVTLSQGAMKMAKKKVIVKRLISVEDFGNIDTLCMDKTGTLTEGKFSLEDYQNINGQRDDLVVSRALLCTSGITDKVQGVTTDPIDNAIWGSVYAQTFKNKLSDYEFIDENEFDYQRRRMSVLVKKEDSSILIAKGAVESILKVSRSYKKGEKKYLLNDKKRDQILKSVEKYELSGYRVLAVSERKLKASSSTKTDEKNLCFIGYLLFKDPVKKTVHEALDKFELLGVNLKVISGDSLIITENIAKEAGIDFTTDQIIDGDALSRVPDRDFYEVCKNTVIFARITPEQKYKIIKTLNIEGHIVGYIGDGVNDAPALKEADVGISVDTGVDIAKDASDIILLEKDLRVLSGGIEAGRKTFGNIMKYILNTISANYGNMFTVAISSLFLKFIPLLPSQILLNNFISDIPLFAVATDNVDKSFLHKPKRWNLTFIKNFMIYYGFVSTIFDLMLILPMVFIFKVDIEVFRTAWFVESSLSEMLVTFTIRTKLPFYKSKPSFWLFWLSVISAVVVISASVFEAKAFEFVRLPYFVWVLIVIDLLAYFIVTELVKKIFFKKFEAE